MNALMRFGGYPEPFLKGNDRFCNQWKRMRLEKLFEEDIRDMSRVQDLRGLRALAELLAARVGGGVNYASLATDLAVTPDTVKAWIGVLESVYYCYTVTGVGVLLLYGDAVVRKCRKLHTQATQSVSLGLESCA